MDIKQKGSAGLVILVIIVVILLIGGVGWYFFHKTTQLRQTLQQTGAVQSSGEKNVLYVGETIDEDGLAADTKEFQPFIDYLVSKLGSQGITKGQFIGTTSVSQMSQLVTQGKIDVVIDSAFPVYVVSKLAGAEVIADRWKGGVGTYHSAIFVKQNSLIKTLDDLRGKMLAFDSKTSTVGYFLPKAELIKQGYVLTEKANPTDPCLPREICYVFVHGNVYDSVANGIVPAGAESELEIDAFYGASISNYRIISKSPDISRFLVATRSDLNPTLRDAIKNELFTMDSTQQGKSVLTSFANTAKFTAIDPTDTTYTVLGGLTDLVEDEIVKQ